MNNLFGDINEISVVAGNAHGGGVRGCDRRPKGRLLAWLAGPKPDPVREGKNAPGTGPDADQNYSRGKNSAGGGGGG